MSSSNATPFCMFIGFSIFCYLVCRWCIQYSSGGFSKTHPSQWGRIFSPPQPHPMFRASPHCGKDFSRRNSTATHRGSTFLPVWPRWVVLFDYWIFHNRSSKLSVRRFSLMIQGFPFKKIFRGHCDPQVVDFGGHFQFERVTYWSLTGYIGSIIINVTC